MQQLTQEQAERCARVCGLEPMCCDGDTVPREWGYCKREGERLVKYEKETNQLSLNPFFWFPRLREALEKIANRLDYNSSHEDGVADEMQSVAQSVLDATKEPV